MVNSFHKSQYVHLVLPVTETGFAFLECAC